MTVHELLAESDVVSTRGTLQVPIAGLAYDSRRVQPGDVFFALGGVQADGGAFAGQAFERGARAAVVKAGSTLDGPAVIEVAEPRRTLAECANRLFGHPSRALTLVGVTGTNGKTTVTYLLESIFRAAGRRCGVIGTTGIRIDQERRPSAFTTPEAPELQALLREMADRGIEGVAFEVSSHALVQRRAYGIECDAAIFTNFTQDHLDYHGTMEAYLDAKLMLFDGRNGARSKPAAAIINVDDPAAPRVIAAARHSGMTVLTFGTGPRTGTDDADLWIERIAPRSDGLELQVRVTQRWHPAATFGAAAPDATREVRLPLMGRFNASNAAAAMAAALALGLDRDAVVRGLESVEGVPGRLECVPTRAPFQVVVDYAHTPDALARALEAVREHASGRVLLVFGCGGDRDRSKRPLMGRIAAECADRAWVTNDNPRSEDPRAIANDVLAGAPAGHLAVELDRRAAIAAAIAEAEPGDIVLIAGKGHETTQTIGGQVLPFDDRLVAREILAGAQA